MNSLRYSKNNYPSNCNCSLFIYFFQFDFGCTTYILSLPPPATSSLSHHLPPPVFPATFSSQQPPPTVLPLFPLAALLFPTTSPYPCPAQPPLPPPLSRTEWVRELTDCFGNNCLYFLLLYKLGQVDVCKQTYTEGGFRRSSRGQISRGVSCSSIQGGGAGGSTVRIVGYVLTTSWEGCVYVPTRSSPPPPSSPSG